MTLDKITIEFTTNSRMTSHQLQRLSDAVMGIADDLQGAAELRIENEPIASEFDVIVTSRRGRR